jgi:hypothetical protein
MTHPQFAKSTQAVCKRLHLKSNPKFADLSNCPNCKTIQPRTPMSKMDAFRQAFAEMRDGSAEEMSKFIEQKVGVKIEKYHFSEPPCWTGNE